jgi:hypothetical protein
MPSENPEAFPSAICTSHSNRPYIPIIWDIHVHIGTILTQRQAGAKTASHRNNQAKELTWCMERKATSSQFSEQQNNIDK